MIMEPAISSGELAVGTTTVLAGTGMLYDLVLIPGSAVSTVKVYDNASAASGTIIAELNSPASGASVIRPASVPIQAINGLTVVVAGTGAIALITYQRR